MIPYFCALLLLGIPIGWAEWTIGRYGGRKGFHSSPGVMGVVGKGPVARYFGIVGVLIPLVVYFYYVVIEAWCLGYTYHYLTQGGIGIDSAQPVADQVKTSTTFFTDFTGQAANGSLFNLGHGGVFVFWLVTFTLNIYFVYRGLSKGIEQFCRWAMPAMGVCGILVLFRVLTLGTPDPTHPEQNVVNGLGFMWNPDFASLGNFRTWLAAAGQIFFSLSVGFGVIINYASYMKKKDDVVLSGLTASATNEFFEVALGGMITLTAAIVFLGEPLTRANTGGTFSTGFFAVPVVFAHMPAGRFFGFLWFFMLFLAAITSSLSMLQPVKAFLEEALGLTAKGATVLLSAVCLLGNLFVLYFSRGLVALDTLDFWVGTFMIFIMAAVQIISFGWVFGLERGWKEAHEGAHMRIPGFYKFVIKYVSPLYLIVIFVGFCIQGVPGYVRTVLGDAAQGVPPDHDAQLAWLVIVFSIVALIAVTAVGSRRWRAQGRDLDGRRGPDDETRAA
jgi:SNF family Na+-dependent transporter